MIVIHITSSAKQGGGPSHVLSLLELIESPFINQYAIFPSNERFSHILGNLAQQSYDFPTSLFSFISLFIRLRSVANCNKKILFHSHGPAAGLLGKAFKVFFKCTHVYTPHGVQFTNYGYLKQKLYLFYESVTAHLIDQIIYISYSEKSTLSSHIASLASLRSIVIENVVNPSKIVYYNAEDISTKFSHLSPCRRPTVAMIGRITNQKNSLIIFDICLLMPDIDFVYVGDCGDQYSEFMFKLNSFNLPNLSYFANVDNLKSFYSEIDLLLAPSKHEGLPYVVLEAVCNYIPVVLSPIQPFLDLMSKYDSPLLNFPTNSSGMSIKPLDYANCIRSALTRSRYTMASHLNSKNLLTTIQVPSLSNSYIDTYCSFS